MLPNTHPATLLGLCAGTLFPDADVKGSPASKVIYIPLEHRGPLHSPVVGGLLSLALFFLSKDLAIGFLVGYMGHLFLDTWNRAGVPLLYPFSRRKFRIMNVKVGSMTEYGLLLVFAFVGFVIILKSVKIY